MRGIDFDRTFFQTSNVWPLDDKADPLSGWPIADVVETTSRAANDWYGKLFIHLRDEFSKFLARLRLVKINFTLLNVDAKELPIYLDRNTYARIEVRSPFSRPPVYYMLSPHGGYLISRG